MMTGAGVYAQTQTHAMVGTKNPFASLIGTVLEHDTIKEEVPDDLLYIIGGYSAEETVDKKVPDDLLYIIGGYSAEATVDDNVADGVLSYMAGVYKEHGYNESGSWAKNDYPVFSRNYSRSYVVKQEDLPAYLESEFIVPVYGSLSSGFGYRPRFGRMHKGIDVSLTTGDPVKCSLPGVVTKVAYEGGGYGNYVVVAHSGGVETRYAHLSETLVEAGDKVKAGDIIGLGGNTGNSTGPHLHFEIRYNGEALNPLGCFGLSSVYR